jgi:hypothetical protein
MASSSTSLLPSEPLPWRPNTHPKLPPGALLDIPDDLLWDLFTEWLHIEAVCRLDSALCQKWRRRRAEFLRLLATKVLLFNREKIEVLLTVPFQRDSFTHKALGAAALNWVLKRGIHLASLRMPYVYNLKEAEQQSIREAVASLALDGRLDKLETISLDGCYYIKDADFAGVLSKCYSSAKSIDIGRCDLAESAAVHIKRCTKLEAFVAKGKESDADMVEIVQACRKLRKVDLGSIGSRLTDEAVLSVAVHCPFLEHLGLQRCSAVTDASVKKVAESCPLLQFVSLCHTKITDVTVGLLCKHCPLLKRVFVGYCCKLTDTAVLTVAEMLPGLTHICLDQITAITSGAVETLASKCRQLEYIDLKNNGKISDVTLMKIAEHCSKLEVLNVQSQRFISTHFVSTAGLTEIATKCPKLKTVSINYNHFSSLEQLFPHVIWNTR